MTRPTRYWADMRSPDFAMLDPARTVAVLPVGATEQHGPHLPLAVDQAIADAIVAEALAGLPASVPVLVLPTQQVGYSPEHSAFAGTLTLSAGTVLTTWIELGECVARAGVRKLLLFNSHGGQASLLDVAARELRNRAQLIVYGCNWWNLPLGDEVNGLFDADEHRFGVHAGEIETSVMLAIRPQDVAMVHAQNFGSTAQQRADHYAVLGNGRSAKLGWAMQDYNPQGAAGNAQRASAEKGEAVVSAAAGQLARLLKELSDLPLSTLARPGD